MTVIGTWTATTARGRALAFGLLSGALSACGGGSSANQEVVGGASGSASANGASGSSGAGNTGEQTGDGCPPQRPNTETLAGSNPGDCVIRCSAGWADCDGSETNGCESSLASPEACGRCIDACTLHLCEGTPSCRTTESVKTAAAIPSVGAAFSTVVVGAVTSDATGIVSLFSTERWDVDAAAARPTEDGPAVQVWSYDGELSWSTTGGWEATAVAASRDFIYVAGNDLLQQLTREGVVVWTRAAPTVGAELFVDADDNVYLVASHTAALDFDGKLLEAASIGRENYVLSLSADNQVRWVFQPEFGGVNYQAALSANRLYLAAYDLLELDLETGALVSELEFKPKRSVSALHVDRDGTLLVHGLAAPSEPSPQSDARLVLVPDAGTVQRTKPVAYLSRIDPDLKEHWLTSFAYNGFSIAVAPSGEIYVDTQDLEDSAPCVARIEADGRQAGVFCFEPEVSLGRLLFPPVADAQLHLSLGAKGATNFRPTLPQGDWAMWGNIPSFPDLPLSP
jgi:hypothetical protein